ncbi:hypothetical protein [Streptomyces sp. NPDC059185]|uniref:hypothetical protein n=1 Tax=Streptomyces sp. NPDC059185 TaxID=3346762 RepID=UPI0036D1637E
MGHHGRGDLAGPRGTAGSRRGAHAQLNLERGVPLEQVRDFKVATLDAVDRIAHAPTTSMPWLSRGQAVDVIAGTTAMAAQQWQTSNPPETLARLYAEGPAPRPRGVRVRSPAHAPGDSAPGRRRGGFER